MSKKIEIRSITTEIRQAQDGSRKVTGLAIPVEEQSQLLCGEFYETIKREAITQETIDNFDIKLYLNHDPSQGTFARSKYGQGSLTLFITDRGLEFETELPQTALGDAVLEGIKRGDYDAMSFAFYTDDSEWTYNPDGTCNRTINSFALIDEISILSCAPAYEVTDVTTRSLENVKQERANMIMSKLDALEKEIDEMTI